MFVAEFFKMYKTQLVMTFSFFSGIAIAFGLTKYFESPEVALAKKQRDEKARLERVAHLEKGLKNVGTND